ncbi:MAG: pantetheine-phosphate adenylyltransferase [Flavobacteriales bacterium]|nr:pantetheine-phosphate adenylyltransferase [Flavobacteriales bacterium]
MRTAVFPGSFDPITKGHQDIVERALPLFDKVIVAIGTNSAKNYLFSLEERKMFIEETFHNPKIEVATYDGLTVDFCKKAGAQFIIRGIRNAIDYNYENSIAQMNKMMHSDIETLFLPTNPELSAINSTIVRDIFVNGGDISKFVPASIKDRIKR